MIQDSNLKSGPSEYAHSRPVADICWQRTYPLSVSPLRRRSGLPMLNATILAVTANAVCDMPHAGMALYVQTARSRGAVGYFGSPTHGRGTRSRYPRPHLLRYK